jgi:hypothetical protein
MRTRSRCRGLTIVEVIAVIVVFVLVVGIALSMLGRTRDPARFFKDSTQVRGIHQGMVLWSQSNKDVYPLPSLVDLKDETVAEQAREKDTTANIMSLLIFNGYFSPELCVSPAEANGSIKVMGNYGWGGTSASLPAKAVNPAKALWDPAFAADFTGGKTGNFSYGHMLPADVRLEKTWMNDFQATEAVVGNRGPQIASLALDKAGARTFMPTIPSSNTYLIRGGKKTWEGNIAYGDNHVTFESRLDPESTFYKDAAGKEWFDCLFFDEQDDPKQTNNFLGIFTKAGTTGAEYKAIWD